jgi:cholest-4-en-3-one 26-monooxygenase
MATERLAVDVLDPELYRTNPHDTWTWMRRHSPVYRDERNGLWVLTRHADVMDVERRSTVFVSGQGYRQHWAPEEANMIAQDDPRHRQQRLLVQHRFTKAGVAEQADQVAALTEELLNHFVAQGAAGGQVDVIEHRAAQLPARLACRLLGYPRSSGRRPRSTPASTGSHCHPNPSCTRSVCSSPAGPRQRARR